MWPRSDLLELFGIELPIVQSPMAGANDSTMAIAVSEAGGLGSLPCAMLSAEVAGNEMAVITQRTSKPFNVNFFCHSPVELDDDVMGKWQATLASYYAELGVDPNEPLPAANRAPFDDEMCRLVEMHKPKVVSFHFGLPERSLLERVKAAGCVVISSATTVDEAVWLEERGCDAIIAQGYEAGGHRGLFLTSDISTQPGTFALVPQIVDAVKLPVIAAGGVADGRGIAAAFALGASGVQVGTAYLHTPEATISQLHRNALAEASDSKTALTNLFTGKPARGLMNRVMAEVGPISDLTPAFPHAGAALAPLKAQADQQASSDFSSLWSGQAGAMSHEYDSAELTQALAAQATKLMKLMST